jgi:DNA-binding XRE family transcriptional regulator
MMTSNALQDLHQSLDSLEYFQKNIKDCGVTQVRLAKSIGVSLMTFYRKSKNASFTASELITMIKLIDR